MAQDSSVDKLCSSKHPAREGFPGSFRSSTGRGRRPCPSAQRRRPGRRAALQSPPLQRRYLKRGRDAKEETATTRDGLGKQGRKAPPGGTTRHGRASLRRAMARAGLARSRSRSRSRSLRAGGVAFLILFSALSASPALAENRNGPIRLRENLWATGHFMGKKSPLSPTPLHSSSLERAEPNHIPKAFSPAVTSIVDDMKDLLTRELLKILLQQKLLEENQGKQDPKEQEMPSLMKLLAKYI
ncbi:neuromedin-B [Liasis olivaceus]